MSHKKQRLADDGLNTRNAGMRPNQIKPKTMKKLLFILCAVLTLLYINGLLNFFSVYDCVDKSDGTDIDICDCNKKYGYDLDWHEEPTNIDIMLSNFK